MKKYLNICCYHVAILFSMLLLGGCPDSKEVDEAVEPDSQFVIVLIDDQYSVDYVGAMTIRGLKFKEGDEVLFRRGTKAEAVNGEEFPVAVERITSVDIIVRITPQIDSDVWSIYCRRQAQTQYLGTTKLIVDEFRLVKNVTLQSACALDRGDVLTIGGEGFEEGDKICLEKSGVKSYATVGLLTADGVTCNIASEVTSGEWTVYCERGADRQLLGAMTLTVSAFPWIDLATLPEGTTVYGRVYSGTSPLADVCVSDGRQIVKSDAAGVYSLISDRENGTVFVSLPSGHEASVVNGIPQFYSLLKEGDRRYDFGLIEANNDNYVLLVTADIQIDNDTRLMVPQSSLQSFKDSFVSDFQKTISTLSDRKVYSVSLGDMVYDKYWYSKKFGIPQYKEQISQFGIPFFHIMGNHDNDPYCAGDAAAERTYKEELAPIYYSLNIGRVHYVALDNIRYVNNGGSQGVTGDCSYTVGISDRQMQWLKDDLATVVDKSAPLIVWMHAPLTNCRVLTPTGNPAFADHAAVASCFDEFTNVLILSGHWHNNHHAAYPGKSNLVEHNQGSVCGSIWYNVKGFNGGQEYGAGTDGTPMGYALYEINGTDVKWRYKGCDVGDDVQFAAYDMNTLKAEYKDQTVTNEILVNVWNWDASWKVEVFEDGSAASLKVTRQLRKDPNYLKYIQDVYLPSNDSADKAAAKAQSTPHIFSAKSVSSSSSVLVRVTDGFGNVYTKQLR